MDSWKFTEIKRIEEFSFNNVLERFHKSKVSGLIRESIQNSLDGKNHELDQPVIVEIVIDEIEVCKLPFIEEIHNRIRVLKSKNDYANETIELMKSVLSKNKVKYISIEDQNTKGLSDPESHDKGTFYPYAYNKGVHAKDDDFEREQQRGGSHGIGKIAFNAASELNLMYFVNCDQTGMQHVCGNAQLIEHTYNGKSYRASGYFTDEKNDTFVPYRNEYQGVFKKDTRGLKIIVPYLRESYIKENEIIKSICDSFFLSILDKNLIVRFDGVQIDANNIKEFILSKEYYIQEVSEIKKDFTPLYYHTLTESENKTLVVKDNVQEYEFNLYFTYDESIKKGRTAIIRTVGMKIQDFKVKNKATKPYNAVLIPKSSIEDAFLKSLENESHTELSYEHIKDSTIRRNAQKFISNLNKEIGAVIEEYVQLNNPVDGEIDTSDIIYDIENKFREELKKESSILKVSIGNKNRNLVKSGKEVRVKKEQKPQNKPKTVTTKRRTKNLGNNNKKEVYTVNPSYIKRISMVNRELLNIDLTYHDNLKNHKKCNIHYALVDGMGVEKVVDFDLRNQVKKVETNRGKNTIRVKEKAFQNVPINDGIIDITIKTNEKYNKAIKYTYYLEVIE